MKAKMSLRNLRIFLLAIVTALALWQVSLRVQAQKVENDVVTESLGAQTYQQLRRDLMAGRY